MWRLLKLLPPELLAVIKRNTDPDLRFAIRQRLGADYRDIPDTIVTGSDGRRFHVGPDPLHWAIYHGLEYEPESTAVLRRIVHEGDIVLDIGASIGWYATLCASLVGDHGHVYAFEPIPSTCVLLDENVRLNAAEDRVTVVEKALSDRTGIADIHIFADRSRACASLSDLGATTFETVSVELTTLDDFLAANAIGRVDMIKCDVEGAELAVLRGAVKLLSRPDAPIVLIELNSDTARAFGYTKQDLWRCLQDQGYLYFYDLPSIRHLRRVKNPKDLERVNMMLCAKRPLGAATDATRRDHADGHLPEPGA